MLIKIIWLAFSYSLLLLVNNSFKPAYDAYCEAYLSRAGANRAKEIFRKKRAMKESEKPEELSQKKVILEKS